MAIEKSAFCTRVRWAARLQPLPGILAARYTGPQLANPPRAENLGLIELETLRELWGAGFSEEAQGRARMLVRCPYKKYVNSMSNTFTFS
jgi:hypothetical protein